MRNDETDQETLDLMQQLEEIRRRKKDLRKKKRKDELKEEINRKLAELADLEESEADKNHRTEEHKREKSSRKKDGTKEETQAGKEKDNRTFVIVSDSIAKYVSVDNADVFAFRGSTIGELTYQLE